MEFDYNEEISENDKTKYGDIHSKEIYILYISEQDKLVDKVLKEL